MPDAADRTEHDRARSFLFVLGIFEGVLPFVATVFGWHPLLALPLYLGAPWWWLAAGTVVVVCAALLRRVERDAARTPPG